MSDEKNTHLSTSIGYRLGIEDLVISAPRVPRSGRPPSEATPQSKACSAMSAIIGRLIWSLFPMDTISQGGIQ